MSAAARGAAGYLYASGLLGRRRRARRLERAKAKQQRQQPRKAPA